MDLHLFIIACCGVGLAMCFYMLWRNQYVAGIRGKMIWNEAIPWQERKRRLDSLSYDRMLLQFWKFKWKGWGDG